MDHILLAPLPPPLRLALAYSPVPARPAWLALLALDARLAQHLRSQREPILTQMRLAWWRDRLSEPAGQWPQGEPLLAALNAWNGHHGALVALVDGWEMLLGEAPLAHPALESFVSGRAAAMHALADVLGCQAAAATAHRAGAGWAIADLAGHLSHPAERETARMLAARHDWRPPRLPRALRPLVVLHGISAHRLNNQRAGQYGSGFWLALRLGILGR